MMKMCLTLLFLTLGAGLSWAAIEDESDIHPKETCLCAQGSCNPGWVQYKHACYRKFSSLLSWPQAEAACVAHESHLASIHSSEENDFVYAFMGRPNAPFSNQAYWIGVNDLLVEGNYMNTDGSKVTILPFGKGAEQPGGLAIVEDVVGSWIVEDERITWNDYKVDDWQLPFVCKYYLCNRLCMREETSHAC